MDKVRVAVLGTGGMGGAHIIRFRDNPRADLVALCDVDEKRIRASIKEFLGDAPAKPKIYTDPARMYREMQLDGVAIVTPHTMHFDHGKEALEAGCHVLMEKPMVTDSRQAHDLEKIVAASGKIFTIGYNTPCTPAFDRLRTLIRDQELGPLELVTGWLSQDWRRATSGTWRQQPELSGGGQMYDSGAHLFNSLVWSVEQPVAAVTAFTDNMDTPVDINGVANIRFENGVLATITISGNCQNSGAGMVYVFTNGRVEIDGWSGAWMRIFRGTKQDAEKPRLAGKSVSPNDNFVDAILGRAEPRTSVRNGVIQSELMDAIYQSASSGRVAKPRGASRK